MPQYTKPFGDFQNMVDTADATKVNAQINQLYTAINGGIDATNAPTLATNVTLVSSAITLTNAQAGLVECTAGTSGFTVTLPDATTQGLKFTIKKKDAGAGTITIAAVNTQTIDGASTRTITAQYGVLNLISDGTSWAVQNADVTTASIGAVDLSSTQTIGGAKTFTTPITVKTDASGAFTVERASNTNQQVLLDYDGTNNRGEIQAVEQGVAYRDLMLNGSGGQVLTQHNTLDDGSGLVTLNVGARISWAQQIISSGVDSGISFKNTGTGGREYLLTSGSGGGIGVGNFGVWDQTAGALRFKIDSSGDTTIAGALTVNGSGGSFANSKATSGYQKLPGGLIIQWITGSVTSFVQPAWPVAFPNACLSSVANNNNAGSTSFVYSFMPGVTNTNAYVQNNGSNTVTYTCIAIGY